MSIGEDLGLKVKAHRLNLFGDLMVLELFHDSLRECDVIKHGSELVHCVVTALNSKFLEHQLFGILGEESLVQKAGCQVLGVCTNKDISSVEAAE